MSAIARKAEQEAFENGCILQGRSCASKIQTLGKPSTALWWEPNQVILVNWT